MVQSTRIDRIYREANACTDHFVCTNHFASRGVEVGLVVETFSSIFLFLGILTQSNFNL
jgi:hypothetical protein